MNFIVTQIKKSSLVQYSLADRTVQFICIPVKPFRNVKLIVNIRMMLSI